VVTDRYERRDAVDVRSFDERDHIEIGRPCRE
jgi:hypothetical protein